MSSPVWRAILKGRFSEASQQDVSFPNGDPDALLVVLNVAQLRSNNVPRTLPDEQLTAVAAVCDKYDTVAICRPFIGDWVKSGLETSRYIQGANEDTLWGFWVFGYESEFCLLVDSTRHTIHTNSEGSCITSRGKHMDVHMPLGPTAQYLSYLYNHRNLKISRIQTLVRMFLIHTNLSYRDTSPSELHALMPC